MEHTIEQYLLKLTNLKKDSSNFELRAGDAVLLNSIARQVARGVALTDRQYELVKSKLVEYRSQFEKNNMNHLDQALETLAYPLRSIDRSKRIYVEDNWLVVKFPFNKKAISQLVSVSNSFRQFYTHEKNSNEHKFKLYEPVINEIVELFKDKHFVIDPELIEINDQIESIKSKKLEFVPYVTDQGLVNVAESASQLANQELGEFNEESAIKYWDRAARYGYRKTDRVFSNHDQLTNLIANRQSIREYVDPKVYNLENIVTAIRELDRFPLLVTLGRKSEYQELTKLVAAFDFVDTRQQILLNRIEDPRDENFPVNQFIKDKNFSRWLDNNIKIVYIFKDSLPKILIKNNWRPIAHLSLGGDRGNTNTASYVEEYCDLSIYHDSQPSYWNDIISRQLNQWV